ncbi:MAG TPA: Crp/Fnr family transcriptional regulator [Prolixibacteraceae bacterium]|nr:Crp/Fnr family transcriptional regulator [Prolixibacteraceae bacterium]
MYQILLNSPLFRGISPEELNGLFQRVNHQVRHFRSGEMLAQAGEDVGRAMLLMEGRLQGEMVDFAGNSLKIEDLDPPQMVAAAFLYGPNSLFPVYLSAKTDGKMLVIQKKDFTAMLSMESRVMVNYINIVSGKAQFLSGKITFLSLKTIKEKIAYYLLQRMKQSGKMEIGMDMTQTSLSDLFGVTRPSLTRTILEMEKQGILVWSRDRVEIKELKKLQQILGR